MISSALNPELTSLLHSLQRHALRDRDFVTPVPGLTLFHLSTSSPVARLFYKPSFALVLQGEKTVTIENSPAVLVAGDFLLASVDIPTYAQVSAATESEPYLSLMLDLNMDTVRQMLTSHSTADLATRHALAMGRADADLLSVLERLLALIDRPAEIPVIADLLQRELIFRLLLTPEGCRLAQFAHVGGQANRVTKAIAWLKAHFHEPFSMTALASEVGMGVSTLHHHFRDVTGVSPLQYQKTLRLHAARNLMLQEGLDAGTVAIRVGYESVSQFNREYRRFFDSPPGRDVKRIRSHTY